MYHHREGYCPVSAAMVTADLWFNESDCSSWTRLACVQAKVVLKDYVEGENTLFDFNTVNQCDNVIRISEVKL